MSIPLIEKRIFGVVLMKERIKKFLGGPCGFSLFELMIVLLIISFLVSIAVLVMMRPTDKAERTVAKANDRIG